MHNSIQQNLRVKKLAKQAENLEAISWLNKIHLCSGSQHVCKTSQLCDQLDWVCRSGCE